MVASPAPPGRAPGPGAQLISTRRAEEDAATLRAGLTAHLAVAGAVVAGADGFIGGALVRTLRGASVPVHGMTRGTPLPAWDRWPARTVFWLASSVSPATAEQRPDLVAADKAAFAELLSRLRFASQPAVVVLASSGGTVYDRAAEPPYPESAPVRPAGAYGRMKVELERALLGAEWVHPVILRISNVYGPAQPVTPGFGVVAQWIQAALEERPLRMLGDVKRDYLYIDDLVAAMLRLHTMAGAAERDRRPLSFPPVLNIGTGRPVSLSLLAEVLQRTTGRTLPVQRLEPRSFDQPDVWLNVGLAQRELAWRARTALEWGIRKVWLAAQRREP
jgi:UDP-glucose 4-epimerase